MKILFLTTLTVTIEHEHYFTKNVMLNLAKRYNNDPKNSIEFATILYDRSLQSSRTTTESIYGTTYSKLYINPDKTHPIIIKTISGFLKSKNPSIIHSNMIEGWDVEAAKSAGIPIILTIHIGGAICPRGGGNGLLRHNDTICDGNIGSHCKKCITKDLPFPKVGNSLLRLFNKTIISQYFSNKKPPIWYLTPLFRSERIISNRKRILDEFKYAHIIAANKKLKDILINYVPENNIHLIPHGVKERARLPLPPLDGPIKFFILSRIQYSKGIVDAIEAFNGIDPGKYELHIIGDAETLRTSKAYFKKTVNASKGKNIIFHGRLPNQEIDQIIGQCHIMIHPAIYLEIYGINISESLSIGRGVLASKCGGPEMQIKDGFNGLLFEPHSIEAIRKTIIKILNNKELIKTFSDNASIPMPIDSYTDKLSYLYGALSKQ